MTLHTEFTINERMPDTTKALARNLDKGIFDTRDEETGRLMTPLEVLERQDPDESHGEPWLEGTNVLQRLLATMNIRTQDDHLGGRSASTVGEFFAAGGGRGRLLFPLWMEARMRAIQSQRFYQSSQAGVGNNSLRPHTMANMIQVERLQRSILNLLVGTMQVGDGRPYNSFFLSNDTAARSRMRRKTEGSPPSVYSLSGSDRTHRLESFAIELQISYKALAEYALPVLDTHLQRVAGRNDRDKEQVSYETHMDGDGNSGGATNTNVSALTGGAGGTVTMPNLLEFLRLYEADGEWVPTIAIGPSASVHILDKSDFGSANHPTFGPIGIAMLAGQGARPELRNVPPIWARSYCTANKILFADASTLRMVYTPLLVERDRVIDGQFEKIVISEDTGFDHLYDGGRRTLDVNN